MASVSWHFLCHLASFSKDFSWGIQYLHSSHIQEAGFLPWPTCPLTITCNNRELLQLWSHYGHILGHCISLTYWRPVRLLLGFSRLPVQWFSGLILFSTPLTPSLFFYPCSLCSLHCMTTLKVTSLLTSSACLLLYFSVAWGNHLLEGPNHRASRTGTWAAELCWRKPQHVDGAHLRVMTPGLSWSFNAAWRSQ